MNTEILSKSPVVTKLPTSDIECYSHLKTDIKYILNCFLTCNLIGRGSNVEFVIVTITEDKFSAEDDDDYFTRGNKILYIASHISLVSSIYQTYQLLDRNNY